MIFKRIVACILLSFLAATALHAERGRPQPLTKKQPLADICRAVFVHTDDRPLYADCKDARWYANVATGFTAMKYTFISLSITIGLIGIIPYAQSEDPTLWWVSAGLLAGGLLMIIPESIVSKVASSKKNSVIMRYNRQFTPEKQAGRPGFRRFELVFQNRF